MTLTHTQARIHRVPIVCYLPSSYRRWRGHSSASPFAVMAWIAAKLEIRAKRICLGYCLSAIVRGSDDWNSERGGLPLLFQLLLPPFWWPTEQGQTAAQET
ncbi:hypothetical protein Dsin_001613 [Dipteronia sinensis]|uniref:Uncharacterized protein n=1 Tax=Dipteronia sinensis TaxID=43782 RepID=A0AAE0EJ56_9ROSI|nr:hypothetical protein Dsin_001613 [Dipteronia sinensis]